jgi:hypothetical protein
MFSNPTEQSLISVLNASSVFHVLNIALYWNQCNEICVNNLYYIIALDTIQCNAVLKNPLQSVKSLKLYPKHYR